MHNQVNFLISSRSCSGALYTTHTSSVSTSMYEMKTWCRTVGETCEQAVGQRGLRGQRPAARPVRDGQRQQRRRQRAVAQVDALEDSQ